MTKQIALTGYYGFGNAGDDAILGMIVSRIRNAQPDSVITVITYPGGDVDAVRGQVDGGAIAGVISGSDIDAVLAVATATDLLIVGGGGLIQDYRPIDPGLRFTPGYADLTFWSTPAIAARARGIPVTSWALGVGPLTTDAGKTEASLLFAQMGIVTVRDPDSAALVRQLGCDRVEVTADPVYLARPADTGLLERLAEVEDIPVGGAMRIGVALRSWGDTDVTVLARQLDVLSERYDADIVFVPFQQARRGLDHDGLFATKVAATMTRRHRRGVIGSELSSSEKAEILAGCDLVVAMRLHAAIFAACAGRPVVALSYDPKVSSAMTELGRGEAVLSLDRLERLADTAAGVYEAGVSGDQHRALEALRRRAALTETLIFQGSAPPPDMPTMSALVASTTGIASRLAASEKSRAGFQIAATENQVRAEACERAYQELERQHQELYDTKAMQIARMVWTTRDRVKDLTKRGRSETGLAPPKWTGRETMTRHLERIVAAYPDADRFVVLPPSIGWDVELFQRPQQIALAFARLGYPVLYHLERPNGAVGYQDRGNGVFVGYLPEEAADILTTVPHPLFLSYVYNFEWSRHLSHPVTVYEHIDDLEVFEHVYRRHDLKSWHDRALRRSQVVAVSAMDLLEEVRGERPDAVLVPNGVDFDHFAGSAGEPPDDMAPLLDGAPIIGYYGALAEWFDYDLIEQVSETLPEMHFVLIGPDYDGTAARSNALHRPNVTWLGPRPYRDLPRYLARFDVATIPFVVNDVTHAVSPLKLFEYMAGGKPIVTPPLRECARYRVVQIADGVDGFVTEIGRALDLAGDPEHLTLLRRTARANTWEARVRTIIEAVERLP